LITNPKTDEQWTPRIMSIDSTVEPPRSSSQRITEAGRLKRVLCVLRLDPAGKFGSIEEQVLTLARSFRERGSVFLPVYLRPLDSEGADQYLRERLPAEALDLSRFRLATLQRLLLMIKQYRIDVVNWNFYHPLYNGYLWALAVLKPRVEHYFTDHISRPAMTRSSSRQPGLKLMLKRALAARYRKVLCVSDYVLKQSREIAGARAQRIAHFVNTDRFRRDDSVRRGVRRLFGMEGEFVAVTVAHLIKEKGIDVAIRALAELPEDVVLWIVGTGAEQGDLRELASSLGLEKRVIFMGQKRHVEPLLQAADCALCPSTWAEAAGLVNLEALACGLPLVASRVGGIPEFVRHGSNGFLVAPGDPHELAERIGQLHRDVGLRQQMGAQACATAVERFSTGRLLAGHLQIYERDEN
jgi:glycosyltransferase involved in cell wall biosynthesis